MFLQARGNISIAAKTIKVSHICTLETQTEDEAEAASSLNVDSCWNYYQPMLPPHHHLK